MKVILVSFLLYAIGNAQFFNWYRLHSCNSCYRNGLCFNENDNLPKECTSCLQNVCEADLVLRFLPTRGMSCIRRAWNDPSQCGRVCPTWFQHYDERIQYCSSCLNPCIGTLLNQEKGICVIKTEFFSDPCDSESKLPCGTCYRANRCFTKREFDSFGDMCRGYLQLKCGKSLSNITCVEKAFSDSCSTCPRTTQTDGRFQACKICIDQCGAKRKCLDGCRANLTNSVSGVSCPLCRAFCKVNPTERNCEANHCRCTQCDECYEQCNAMSGNSFNLFNPCKCLNREENAPVMREKPRARILGGAESCDGDWPWIAYVYLRELPPLLGGRCGGTIFNKKWIITAGHCMESLDPQIYAVALGEHNLILDSGREVYRNVSRIILHPFYDPLTFDYDIALLELEKEVTFTKYIQPLRIAPPGTPTDNTNPPSFAGELCNTVGWGVTSSPIGVSSTTLNQLSLRITPSALCTLQTLTGYDQGPVSPRSPKFCAGAVVGEDTCEGDSGGPLFCLQPDNTYLLHGITSYGTPVCGLPGKPGVYTKIADLSNWIDLCIFANKCSL